MNTTTIVIIVLVIAVAAGVAYYMMNKEPAVPVVAPAPVVMPAPTPVEVTTPEVVEEVPVEEEVPEPVSSHPLAGNKFLIAKIEGEGVIVPTTSGKKFKIDATGARTEDMIIEFMPVENSPDMYILFAKEIKKYLKYSSNGFGVKTTKPKADDKDYHIKFTKVGDDYAMSYMTKDDDEKFFGYDGSKMITSDSVTDILNTGLVNTIDAGVSGFILPGHFGSDTNNFREYGVDEGEDPIENLEGCLSRLPDIDMDDEVRDSLLSVAFNPEADSPCRVYPQSDTYSHDAGATGWVTTCIDNTKDIKQGCLL